MLVAADSSGRELGKIKFPTDKDFDVFSEHLIEKIKGWTEQLNQPLQGLAIAMPGVIDYETGIVKAFGNLDWTNVDIVSKLKEHFHVPISIDNDGNYGALGEARSGAGKGHRVVLYVTISTGIGTGITVDGKIDPALAKSEAGHMHFRHEGKLVDWESFASGKAFFEKYKKMGKDTPLGDPSWAEWAEEVSLGIGSLMAIIQPDVIVIGGSMGEHFHKYSEPLVESIKAVKSDLVSMPEIVAAHEPNKAVINGGFEAINDSLG